jgi:hypothetical protein
VFAVSHAGEVTSKAETEWLSAISRAVPPFRPTDFGAQICIGAKVVSPNSPTGQANGDHLNLSGRFR